MNPFHKGDKVKRISKGHPLCPVGTECIVQKIHENDVYYKDGQAAHYCNWKLVARPEAKRYTSPQQTEKYFKYMQIAYMNDIKLMFTNADNDNTWIPIAEMVCLVLEEYSPIEQWKIWEDSIQSGSHPVRYKLANLPVGCPSDQYSDSYFEFWDKLYNEGYKLEKFYWTARKWAPVSTRPSTWKDENTLALFRYNHVDQIVADCGIGALTLTDNVVTADTQLITKENTMEKNVDIEIKINGEQVNCSSDSMQVDDRTDLEKASRCLVEEYNSKGTYVGIQDNLTARQVKKLLQDPANLGKTYRIFKFDKAFTTDIPVIEIKTSSKQSNKQKD